MIDQFENALRQYFETFQTFPEGLPFFGPSPEQQEGLAKLMKKAVKEGIPLDVDDLKPFIPVPSVDELW